MKIQFNVEFTPEEIVKHAEDIGRRWLSNLFKEGTKHIKADDVSRVLDAITGAFRTASDQPKSEKSRPSVDAEFENPTRCTRYEATPTLDEAWLCHRCGSSNMGSRQKCRNCDHARCDVIITPVPGTIS